MADTKTSEPAADEVFARCSFCTKSNTEVERLIAGPGAVSYTHLTLPTILRV